MGSGECEIETGVMDKRVVDSHVDTLALDQSTQRTCREGWNCRYQQSEPLHWDIQVTRQGVCLIEHKYYD